ncbi:MAG: magnesium/cobalt transporter CorA [Formivibrio sp.]|nr:magnesium/cobalt transporter CorA [Formivibrio sp.]
MARNRRNAPRSKATQGLKVFPTAAKAGLAPGTLQYVGMHEAEDSFATLIEYGPMPGDYQETRFCDPEQGRQYQPHFETLWLNLHGLGNLDLFTVVGERFKLHPLVMEDILNTEHRPKIDAYPGYIFITTRLIFWTEDGSLGSEQVSLILGERFVLTFQEKPTGTFSAIREALKKSESQVRKLGGDYLVYLLLDKLVDRYYTVLEQIGEQVEKLEDEIVTAPSAGHFLQVQESRRMLQYLKRGLWPLREVVNTLLRNESKLFDEETLLYLRDVYDHLLQLIESTESLREIVISAQETCLSLQSQHLNIQMRRLTALTAVFMPLSLIAGIYGMNFEFMPELHWHMGYFAVLGGMGLIGLLHGWVFWRRKWL